MITFFKAAGRLYNGRDYGVREGSEMTDEQLQEIRIANEEDADVYYEIEN
jgi:hypothetical protein